MVRRPAVEKPPLVLTEPHRVAPPFQPDAAFVRGKASDHARWEKDFQHRHKRDTEISRRLCEGRAVIYTFRGHTMWPLVQSGDFCIFHPVRAVTADEHSGITKQQSVIHVGDVVLCETQPHGRFFSHLVVNIEYKKDQPVTYTIGNITGNVNVWCHEKHIFGILVGVQVFHDDNYISRPLPKDMYHEVRSLLVQGTDEAESEAERRCFPRSVHLARR